MALNKSTGNMYAFVSHTYNPMKGECEHSCPYCFMKRNRPLPPLRLEPKELIIQSKTLSKVAFCTFLIISYLC